MLLFRRLATTVLILISHASFALPILRMQVDAANNGHVKIIVSPKVVESQQDIDLLFVVDNSGSMQSYQQLLSQNAPVLASTLGSFRSLNVAVMTTDMDGPCDQCNGKFVGGVMHSSDANFVQEVSKRLILGDMGSGQEKLFDPVISGLSSPLIDGPNAGFLRPKSHLAVFFLSDAEDQSTKSPQEFVSFLETTKGLGNFTLGAFIIPSSVVDLKNCYRDDVNSPLRIEKAVSLAKGSVYNLCDGNYADTMKQFGKKVITEITRTIRLPIVPIVGTVTVKYGEFTLAIGDVEMGWVYETSTNSIILGRKIDWDTMPKADLEIEFNY